MHVDSSALICEGLLPPPEAVSGGENVTVPERAQLAAWPLIFVLAAVAVDWAAARIPSTLSIPRQHLKLRRGPEYEPNLS